MLAFGLARQEVAAQLWGGSFLLLVLYSLIGSWLLAGAAARSRRRERSPTLLSLPTRGVAPHEPFEATLDIHPPRVALPGFSLHFSVQLRWLDRPAIRCSSRLHSSVHPTLMSGVAGARGDYRAELGCIEIRDLFGFASGRVQLAARARLVVHPERLELAGIAVARSEGGAAPRASERKRRADEPSESRHYLPGDDPRRLNWKVFARHGELFVRANDRTPPPARDVLLVLDASARRTGKGAPPMSYLDRAAAIVAACARSLAREGVGVAVLISGVSLALDPENEEELLTRLSGVAWSRGIGRLPPAAGDALVIVTTPHSVRIDELLDSARGSPIRIFVPLLPAEPVAVRRRSVRDFVFVARSRALPPDEVAAPNAAPASAARAFAARLRRDPRVEDAREV